MVVKSNSSFGPSRISFEIEKFSISSACLKKSFTIDKNITINGIIETTVASMENIGANRNNIIAIIQPGGALKDDLIVEIADKHGIPMAFTGSRHFKH